jgi:YggT family protein
MNPLFIIDTLLQLLWFALLGRAILSWMPISQTHPAVLLLNRVTEPILQPIRRVLPRLGGADLSPLVALIIVVIIRSQLR